MQSAALLSFAHGSTTGSGGGTGHEHGAHAVSGGHVGQMQLPAVLVPPTIVVLTDVLSPAAAVPLPLGLTPTAPPVPHAQSQGGHEAPAAHAGHAQVQVPPPPTTPPPQLPPPPPPPPPQSHVHAGQLS